MQLIRRRVSRSLAFLRLTYMGCIAARPTEEGVSLSALVDLVHTCTRLIGSCPCLLGELAHCLHLDGS